MGKSIKISAVARVNWEGRFAVKKQVDLPHIFYHDYMHKNI